MSKETDSHFAAIISGAVALLLALYLILPVVYAVPMIALKLPDSFVDTFFTPLESLGGHFPAYKRMVEREAEVCRNWGFLKD